MRTGRFLPIIFALGIACSCWLMIGGTAVADGMWTDEIGNSLAFYQSNYPGSDWAPYEQKLAQVKNALARGDDRLVRVKMGKWFKMLRARAHGIDDVAADELYNFAVMVTPLQEYGISIPSPMPVQ